MMLAELRKVIPSFLTRVDLPDRGMLWSRYLSETNSRLEEMADRLNIRPTPAAEVTLTDWDPDAERKISRRRAVWSLRILRRPVAGGGGSDAGGADHRVDRIAGGRAGQPET